MPITTKGKPSDVKELCEMVSWFNGTPLTMIFNDGMTKKTHSLKEQFLVHKANRTCSFGFITRLLGALGLGVEAQPKQGYTQHGQKIAHVSNVLKEYEKRNIKS